MAFKSEEEKKAYEADIAWRLFANNLKNEKAAKGESTQRQSIQRVAFGGVIASAGGVLFVWLCAGAMLCVAVQLGSKLGIIGAMLGFSLSAGVYMVGNAFHEAVVFRKKIDRYAPRLLKRSSKRGWRSIREPVVV